MIVFNGDKTKKVIAYKGDREPVKVFYRPKGATDPVLQEDVSYRLKTAESDTSVTYQSEYKKNLMNMSVEGNTEQKQYEGYNLAYCSTDNYFSSYVYYNILSKNSFTLTTKNSTMSEYLIFNIPVKPNTKVKISYNFTRNFNNSVRFIYWANSGLKANAGTYISQYGATTKTEGSVSQTITTGNTQFLGISFYIKETADIIQDAEILITDLMVTYDTEKTEFEQYVGGKPSPSVEYPQTIENSSNVSVELEGKNLFKGKRQALQSGVTFTSENGVISGIGTPTQSMTYSLATRSDTLYLKPNVTYTVRTRVITNTLTNQISTRVYTAKSNTFVVNVGNVKTETTQTIGKFTLTEEQANEGISIQTASQWVNGVYGEFELVLDLLEGSYTADTIPPYEPYFEPVTVNTPISLNKIGDRKDTLSIDFVSKKATVTRQVLFKNLLEFDWEITINTANNNTIFQTTIPNSTDGFCNRSLVYTTSTNEELESGMRVEVSGTKLRLVFAGNIDVKNDSNSNRGDLTKLTNWLTLNDTVVALKLLYLDEIIEEYTGETWVNDILNLPTQNQTNIITVNSTLPISKLDVGYAIWGGRDESIS